MNNKTKDSLVAGSLCILGIVALCLVIHAQLSGGQAQHQVQTIQQAAPPPKPVERFPATATWYGAEYDGRLTASGAHKSKAVPEHLWHFDMFDYTAAHLTLPFGQMVRVTWLGRHVDVMITDRPKKGNDVLDLSAAAFHELAPVRRGPGRLSVTVEVLP